MNRPRITTVIISLATGGLLLGLGGCVDEEVVFAERPIFEDPPSGAASFLGYSEREEKLTVCGNCHVGFQGQWEGTGHAEAWAVLQESGSVQDFCRGCHTVNERGNATEGSVGFDATENPRYHDVQCESCHGPGLEHVDNPDGVKPLASITAGTDLDLGCGECHSGTHHPFTDQWAASEHGRVPALATAQSVGSFCLPCHEGETAMRQIFGEESDFVEQDDGQGSPITCATCHDPHGSENIANLRAPVDVASEDHLCVRCHSREGTPDTGGSNFRGPHGFQGNLVLGRDVGWVPPNSDLSGTGRIVSTHGTDANPELCATCHVARRTITDAETGEFQVEAVGHTFEATPCLDPETGLPRDDCTIQEVSFQACTESGCHGTADAARSAFVTVKNRINNLLDDLWDDADGDAVLETSDGGLLPQVLAQEGSDEINPFDSRFTTAEGALWNAQVAFTVDRPQWADGRVEGQSDGFGSHKGSGDGVHNPFLLEALLTASIDAVENEYGLTSSVSTQRQLTPPPGVSLR